MLGQFDYSELLLFADVELIDQFMVHFLEFKLEDLYFLFVVAAVGEGGTVEGVLHKWLLNFININSLKYSKVE